jgi:hypothetical protein
VEAKGHLREVWNAIYTQAEGRLRAAFAAWAAAGEAEDERRLQDKERRKASTRARVITTASSDGG